MFRRRVVATGAFAAAGSLSLGAARRWLTVDNAARDKLTQYLTTIKEECKGQTLDLADMSDAARAAARAFQDAAQKTPVDDAQFKGKMTTLSASVKAYNTRLSNLQNESRSIQTEVDAILKLLWGTENPHGAKFSSPPPHPAAAPVEDSAPAADGGFDVEPPVLSKILESEPKVERVEAERVVADQRPLSPAESANDSEMEVETIEIEVEPAQSSAEADDPVDTMKITDITKELYERGANFSDCLDARTLRQRYRDVLSGKILTGPAAPQKASKAYTEPLSANDPSSNQPRIPTKPQQQQQQYQQQQPNTTESGLAYDPYPNAQRKMVDPMKHVWEIKHEIATEKGIDAMSVDLWSGKTKLDDSKRLYDYPSIQNYPIEVRQKGDIPS